MMMGQCLSHHALVFMGLPAYPEKGGRLPKEWADAFEKGILGYRVTWLPFPETILQ